MLTYNLQRTLIPSIAVYFQKEDVLTTGTGAPVGLKTATMTVGPRGPVLLQDFVFTDEMAHFNRERIPERVVHAKGAGQSIQYYLSPSLSSLTSICVKPDVQPCMYMHHLVYVYGICQS